MDKISKKEAARHLEDDAKEGMYFYEVASDSTKKVLGPRISSLEMGSKALLLEAKEEELRQSVMELFEKRGVKPDNIEEYAWPGMFATTSGPNGGIGGAAITYYQIKGYCDQASGSGVLLCCGKIKFVKRFQPLMSWNE
jgi:hypothetical protein